MNTIRLKLLMLVIVIAGKATAQDAGVELIVSPVGTVCTSTITPQLFIKNFGVDPLDSAIINYRLDNGAVQSLSVIASPSLAPQDSILITLTGTSVSTGLHSFIAYTSMPNGFNDADNTNDTMSVSFTYVTSGLPAPVTQSFDNATFPPLGYTLVNPDNDFTWEQTILASHSGAGAMYIDNFDYDASGQMDELILPAVDLTSVNTPVLSFWVAYQLYTDTTSVPNYSDTLEVLLSTDCGASYSSIYKKYAGALTTAIPYFSTTQFVPTSNQWRKESINLSAFGSFNTTIIKFRNITGYENDLFVDDINIDNSSGVQSNLNSDGIEVYPNPGNGYFRLNIHNQGVQNLSLVITDAIGNSVMAKAYTGETFHDVLNLSTEPSGIYLLKLVSKNGTVTKKLVVTH